MMFSVGQRLRAARLNQGLDLHAVVARTKINEKFLKAIEADDRKSFPSGFFYKSFVDQYARALSVDTGEIDEHINAILTAEAPLPLPGEGEMPVRRASALVVKSRGSRSRTYVSIATFCLVLVGCSGFYAWWRNLSAQADVSSGVKQAARAEAKTNANAAGVPSGESVVTSKGPQIPPTPEQPNAVPVALTTPATPRPDEGDDGEDEGQSGTRFQLELMARQETWLSISSDGLMIFKGTLAANESKTVEGKGFAKLRVNDAAALEVKLNGKAIGPLGAPGQFRIVVFTRDKFHVLDSAKESD
jgi:cytoskeletal protein RodZ